MRRWVPSLILGALFAIGGYLAEMVYYPQILMWAATERVAKAGAYNRMTPIGLPTEKQRIIVRPSPDIAYSTCPYDISKGPVFVDIQPVPAPYWSLSVFDHRTDVAYVRNNVDSNGAAIRIVIAKADQPIPQGIQAVRVEGTTGIAVLRVLVQDRRAFGVIDAARHKSSCASITG